MYVKHTRPTCTIAPIIDVGEKCPAYIQAAPIIDVGEKCRPTCKLRQNPHFVYYCLSIDKLKKVFNNLYLDLDLGANFQRM